jgi:OTU domain-containing protein 6
LNLTSSKIQLTDTVFSKSDVTFIHLRQLAADQLRTHADMYAPFLCLSDDQQSAEYDAYCDTVESITAAKWGGQTEINAISSRLKVPIWVYEVDRPVLKMGAEHEDSENGVLPLKISYHRHFYALGEHYNSVKQIELI